MFPLSTLPSLSARLLLINTLQLKLPFPRLLYCSSSQHKTVRSRPTVQSRRLLHYGEMGRCDALGRATPSTLLSNLT